MYRRAHVEVDKGQAVLCHIPDDLAINSGVQCIIEVDKVLEFGHVLKIDEANDAGARQKGLPAVLRRATLQDQAKGKENALMSKMAMESCSKSAKQHGLRIRFLRVRYSFDRSVLRVVFSAEENTDVKPLAKDLASELRARIDMRQLGVRDEAGLIGGLGPCGRKLCCCTWLHKFESINVKMVKAQNLSMSPGAMSGCCGRLKCCLRYEYELYRALGRGLPRQGSAVACPDGKGIVVGKDVLGQRISVRLEDNRVSDFDACDVKEEWSRKPKAAPSANRPSGEPAAAVKGEDEDGDDEVPLESIGGDEVSE